MKLSWNGGPATEVKTCAALERALAGLDRATLEFVVLEDGNHGFAQAGAGERGFTFEIRDAIEGSHRQLIRPELTWDEVQTHLAAYLQRAPGWQERLEWLPATHDGRRAKGLGLDGKVGLRRSGLIMLAFGLLALVGGALEQRRTADFLAHMGEVRGEVVAIKQQPSGGQPTSIPDYDVWVRFIAEDGASYTATGVLRHPPAIGGRLPVLYDRRSPARSPTLDPNVRFFNSTILLVTMGALALLLGAGMVLWARPR